MLFIFIEKKIVLRKIQYFFECVPTFAFAAQSPCHIALLTSRPLHAAWMRCVAAISSGSSKLLPLHLSAASAARTRWRSSMSCWCFRRSSWRCFACSFSSCSSRARAFGSLPPWIAARHCLPRNLAWIFADAAATSGSCRSISASNFQIIFLAFIKFKLEDQLSSGVYLFLVGSFSPLKS